jgi:hypothetical protein
LTPSVLSAYYPLEAVFSGCACTPFGPSAVGVFGQKLYPLEIAGGAFHVENRKQSLHIFRSGRSVRRYRFGWCDPAGLYM